MTREEIDDFADEVAPDEEILVPDGLDGGFIGLSIHEDEPRAAYSVQGCIKSLMKDMTLEEATEYFWYNVAGVKGGNYPIFVEVPDE